MRPAFAIARTASFRRVVSRPLVALAILLLLCGRAQAADGPDSADYQAFFNPLFARVMADEEIPGLAAVLVRDDRIVFRAGYGVADLETREPVDPAHTRFPLGSISKLLTSVAVLQLAEQGAIDLNADIDRYIAPIAVDHRFPEPVTMRHLLTHTDGFDVRWLFGAGVRTAAEVPPLGRLLAQLPPRVVAPGKLYLYSDVGMTVAGYAVERVSGEPFAHYMDAHVLGPLDMRRTTFRPIDERSSRADFARGYDYDDNGVLRPAPVVYPRAVPASGVTGPVEDMAHFIIALLNDGRFRDRAVLAPDFVRTMQQQHFTQAPGVPGTAFGFYESNYRGHHYVLHGGLMPGFTTVLVLFPEEHAGLCIAANRFDLVQLFEQDLLQAFLDRFHPPSAVRVARAAASAPLADPAAARALEGAYRSDQYSRFSIDKLVLLIGWAPEIRVQAQPDGSLVFLPEGSRWRPAGPLLFQNETTGERVAFRLDADGRGHRIVGSAQFMSYRRIGAFEQLPMQIGLALALALLASAGAIFALRGPRGRLSPAHPLARILQWQRGLALGLAALTLAFAATLVVTLAHLDVAGIIFGEPGSFAVLRCVPLALGLLALAQVVLAGLAHRHARRLRRDILVYAASAVAALLLLPVLAAWNLVSLPFSI